MPGLGVEHCESTFVSMGSNTIKNAESGGERRDQLDPDSVRYSITAREIAA